LGFPEDSIHLLYSSHIYYRSPTMQQIIPTLGNTTYTTQSGFNYAGDVILPVM
jgi:hypothetical protein